MKTLLQENRTREIQSACDSLRSSLLNCDADRYKKAKRHIESLWSVLGKVKNGKYLIRKKGKKGYMKAVAHIWNGEDTACKMYSTGGLVAGYYEPSDDIESRRICKNCLNCAGIKEEQKVVVTITKKELRWRRQIESHYDIDSESEKYFKIHGGW